MADNAITLKAALKQMAELGISDQELADSLLVSRPMIERWREGKNLPHRALLEPILARLTEFIEHKTTAV